MSANFEFFKDCVNEDSYLQELYDKINQKLDQAEEFYWEEPVKCACILQEIAEAVCHIYNHYYEIGIPETTSLKGYLCYGTDEKCNKNVSLFFSAVRNDQRNHLNEIRSLGEECVFLEENPQELAKRGDALSINVRRMMLATMEVLKDMCTLINRRQDVQDEFFFENLIPREEKPVVEEAPKKESFWDKLRKKNKGGILD